MEVLIKVKDTDLMFIGDQPYVHSDILDTVYSDLMNYYEPNIEIVFDSGYEYNTIEVEGKEIEVDFKRWQCKERKIYFNYTVLD